MIFALFLNSDVTRQIMQQLTIVQSKIAHYLTAVVVNWVIYLIIKDVSLQTSVFLASSFL